MLKYIDFKNTNPQIQVQEATTYGVCTSHPSKPIKKHLKFEKTCPKVMMQARTSGTDVWLKTTLSHLHVAIHKSCCPHSTAGVIWCYRSRSWWAPVAASWRTSVRWRTAGWHRPISSAAAVQRTPWWVSWRIWTSPVWWISWRISWWTPPAFIITSPPTKPTHITRWICCTKTRKFQIILDGSWWTLANNCHQGNSKSAAVCSYKLAGICITVAIQQFWWIADNSHQYMHQTEIGYCTITED